MKTLVLIALVAMMGCLCPNKLKATHLTAANIAYAFTGTPNTWLVIMTAYRDCSGGTARTCRTGHTTMF